MLLPVNADVPMQRRPLANLALIAATALASLAILRADDPGALVDGAFARHRFLMEVLGSAFVHAGPWHLAGNMIVLFCFGNAVNAKLGHGRYLALYAATAALSGLAWSVLDGRLAVGASGAVMGIMGAFLVLYPRNDVTVFYWFVRFGTFAVSAVWVVLFYVVADAANLVVAGRGSHVATLAHLAGAVAGAGIAVALVATRLASSERGEENLVEWLRLFGFERGPGAPRARFARDVTARAGERARTGRALRPQPARPVDRLRRG